MTQSLRALLANLIDYAGLYPPAALPLPEVLTNYQQYLLSPQAWILNRLVLPKEKFGDVKLAGNWRITLLVDDEPGPLPPQIETLETRSGRRLSLPTYCEVPLDRLESGYAKIRTTDPTSEALAEFLHTAAQRRLPFKATAGLHHPIRSATMHGFLNVFIAATFAWKGAWKNMDHSTLTQLLNDTNPQSFEFENESLRWRDWTVSTADIQQARREFAHSFGSCSFEEPVNDLRELGLL